MKAFCVFFALILVVACGSVPDPASRNLGSTANVAGFDATYNAFRRAQGLGPMRENAALSQAAQAHAQDMNARGYFSHTSRDGPNGETLVQRAASGGCTVRAGAENIAQGQRSEKAVFDAWRNSAGHRRNLEGRGYTVYGLGRSGDYWVMKLASAC